MAGCDGRGDQGADFPISFTGDLAFEINVPADQGMALWSALMNAGSKYWDYPYGTEAMHVLRAEKGFIIVGQDTDGSLNPYDMGMGWIVGEDKDDFIGKRSLTRKDMADPLRKQFVGILTEDPAVVLPEGAQLVSAADAPAQAFLKAPVPMQGHVSSSYWSSAAGRSIAMGIVKGGLARKGERLVVPLEDGRNVPVVLGDPIFFDTQESANMVELSYRPLSKLALASRSSGARAEAPVHLWELPRRTMVTLRLDPRDKGLVERAETALGLALPRQPNTLTTDAKDAFVLWTSPDEFMIDLPGDLVAQGAAAAGAAARIEALSGALAADFASVVEVSDQMAGIGLGGSHWREVWSKVSALDLHESQFAPGACAQTLAAKSNVPALCARPAQ